MLRWEETMGMNQRVKKMYEYNKIMIRNRLKSLPIFNRPFAADSAEYG